MRLRCFAFVLAVGAAAVAFAQVPVPEPAPIPATYLSFASDTFHNGPTFKGFAGGATFSSKAEVDLMFDLNNDNYGGIVTFKALLSLKAEAYDYRCFFIGSQYLHVWKVHTEMMFTFVNPTPNQPIISIGFKEGVLTSWSASPSTLGETMTLQNSQYADPSIFIVPQPLLASLGVTPANFNCSKDVAFTFTHVRSLAPVDTINAVVPVDRAGNFRTDWVSEGSFSASGVLCK